jgi:hypothetical protein
MTYQMNGPWKRLAVLLDVEWWARISVDGRPLRAGVFGIENRG